MTVPKINSAHGSDTRNILNRAIDSINVQGKSIQDLVAEGQLTPGQYAELIQTVNGLIARGEVSFDDININKGKLLPKHLSEEVLKMVTGDAPVNATPADGSVTEEKIADKSVTKEKTSFINDVSLFSGDYITESSLIASRDEIFSPGGYGEDMRVAYLEIRDGAQYTVRAQGHINRFIVAFSNEILGGSTILKQINKSQEGMTDESVTVTNSGNHKYLLIYAGYVLSQTGSTTFKQANMQVREGADYTFRYTIENNEVMMKEEFNSEFNSELNKIEFIKNLYTNGRILGATLSSDTNHNGILGGYTDSVVLPYVELEGNGDYTIKAIGEMNRFQLAFTNSLEVGSRIERVVSEVIYPPDRLYNKTHTVTNEANYKYLLISAGYIIANEIFEPAEISAVSGNVIPDKIPTVLIDGEEVVFKSELGDIEALEQRDNNLYYSPDHSPEHFEDTEAVYSAYDELVDISDGYVTQELLGVDDWGNNIYCYSFERPPHRTAYDIHKPRIGITTSVHGDERSSVSAVYNVMKDLVVNPHKQEKIERMKSLMNFYIIPVAVPSGFDDNTRTNRNGVNINRNFDYYWEDSTDDQKGSTPFSEKESQIIRDWLVAKELDQYIDYHRADMGETGQDASWFASTNRLNDTEWTIPSRHEYLKVIANLSTRYSQRYSEIPSGWTLGYANTYMHYPQTHQYANDIGILGTLLEVSERFIQFPTSEQRLLRNTWATDLIGNYLFEIANRYI